MDNAITEAATFFQNHVAAMKGKVSSVYIDNYTKHINTLIDQINQQEKIISDLQMTNTQLSIELAKTKHVYDFWKEEEKSGVQCVIVHHGYKHGFLWLCDMFTGYKIVWCDKQKKLVKSSKIILEI